MANKKLNAVITIGGAVSSSLRSAFGTVKNETNKIGSALRNLEAQQRQLSTAIQTFGRMGKNVDGMRQRYVAMTDQVNRLRAANERLLAVERARLENSKLQQQLRSKMAETAVVGAAIALPAVAAFKRASEFNYELQVIGNTADMTSDQVRKMGMDLLTLSDRTGQGAVEMRKAIGFLVAAGQDVGTAQANLVTIGRTATATASEIEDVAKASFTLGDALKIDPSKMQKALDILVQSGKEGNFEFKAMAENLPTLGASFQALKMTGTEAVATMGAALQIARKGAGDEAEAANNLKNFLAKILSPETLKKAKKLGSDLYGVINGAQKKGENPFDAAVKEINRITKGGDQKLIGELFGDMQVQNFLRPMLQNLDEYKKIKTSALSADGVVDRDFVKMMGTSKKATDDLKNAFFGLSKVVGDSLEPVFGKLAETFTPIVRTARDFVQENPKLVGGVIATAAAFTTLRLAMLGGRLAFAMIGGQALKFAAIAARLRAGFVLASAAMPAVVTGIRAIGLAFVSTGIGAIITGIALAGLLIYRNWDGISAFMGGVFNGILQGVQPTVQVFKDFYEILKPLHPVFEAIGVTLRQGVEWFTSLFGPVKYTSDELKAAGESGMSFGQLLAKGINLALLPLTTLIEGITWVTNNIGAAIDKVSQFKDVASTKIGGAWDATKTFFGGEPEPAAAAPGVPSPMLPQPAMATARGQGGTYTDASQNTIQIVQQPGENNRDLAKRITEEQERQRGIRQRSAMTDGAMAQ